MDATRAEVEKELERMQDCVKSVHLRMARHAADIMKMGDDVAVYRFCERVLQGILDRTAEPTVEGES